MTELKFSKDQVWSYFEGKIKVFVPSPLILPFERFTKTEGIEVKVSAEYNTASASTKKRASRDAIELVEGRDYIATSNYKEPITKWLKKAYKGLK